MCTLPNTVSGVTRSELLRSYQEYQGADYDPADLHAALTWRTSDAPKMPQLQISRLWTLVGKDLKAVKVDDKVMPPPSKRKNNAQGGKQPKRARLHTDVVKPSAMRWDRINYSCAYDTLFTIHYDIWQDHPS
jgi:hypothetical protein